MEDEELKHIINTLKINIDNKIDEPSKSIAKSLVKENKYAEGKINENPLAYMTGALSEV